MSMPNLTALSPLGGVSGQGGVRLANSTTGVQVDLVQSFEAGAQSGTIGTNVRAPTGNRYSRTITVASRSGETFDNLRDVEQILRGDGLI